MNKLILVSIGLIMSFSYGCRTAQRSSSAPESSDKNKLQQDIQQILWNRQPVTRIFQQGPDGDPSSFGMVLKGV